MGGKALRKIGIMSVRITKTNYDRTELDLLSILPKMYPKSKFHVIQGHYNKADFGDIDILVSKYEGMPNITETLKLVPEWNSKGFYKNGSVTSVDYNNFQVDLNFVSKDDWYTSIDFFDFDPSGNLMGKIAHKFGLKYGHVGLVYPYRGNSGKIVKDIIISKDSKKIFKFLGLDYEIFSNGFYEKKEIFDYVINSKFFNSDIFKFENLNAVDRKRNRKRKTYNEFLEYINTIQTGTIAKREPNFIFEKDKSKYLDLIHDNFPEIEFIKQIHDLDLRSEELSKIHAKFNGKMVIDDIRYLRGKVLGKMLRGFEESIGTRDEYEKYILANTTEDIMQNFRAYHIAAITVKPTIV